MKKICIVGEKNVGKSSLFNILSKSNKSSVINYHGYTRDANKCFSKLNNVLCELIDTAGIGYEKTSLDYFVFKKTWQEVKSSDLLIILSDIYNFNSSINKNFFSLFKNFNQEKIFVLNKIDLLDYNDILKFKNEDLFLISIKKNIGIKDLIIKINNKINNSIHSIDHVKDFLISVVGKVNSGKSSLVNRLSGSDQMIVYDEDGTTRDNIRINIINKKFDIMDTPGVKKFGNIRNKLDVFQSTKNYSVLKTNNISILNIDITKNITRLDLSFINKNFINIIVFNKCDLVSKSYIKKTELFFKKNLKFDKKFVYNFLSSKYNFGVFNLFKKINNIINFYNKLLLFKNFNFKKSDISHNLKFKNIRFIKIERIYPLKINVFLIKNNFSQEDKKFLTFLIIKEFNLKSFFFVIKFF